MGRSGFPFQRKMAVAARLLRGEPLEVARETNVNLARLGEWRDRALAGAASALKERERDERDDEIARLKAKVGEITMDSELLYAKIAAMEGKRPLAVTAVRVAARALKAEPAAPVVEIEIGGAHVWIWRDADIGMAMAILRALRTSPGAK